MLLADDHALVRAGLKRILDAERGVTVVGEVEDGAAALAALKTSAVDVLVLDLSMPGVDGFGVLAKPSPAALMAPRRRRSSGAGSESGA